MSNVREPSKHCLRLCLGGKTISYLFTTATELGDELMRFRYVKCTTEQGRYSLNS